MLLKLGPKSKRLCLYKRAEDSLISWLFLIFQTNDRNTKLHYYYHCPNHCVAGGTNKQTTRIVIKVISFRLKEQATSSSACNGPFVTNQYNWRLSDGQSSSNSNSSVADTSHLHRLTIHNCTQGKLLFLLYVINVCYRYYYHY